MTKLFVFLNDSYFGRKKERGVTVRQILRKGKWCLVRGGRNSVMKRKQALLSVFIPTVYCRIGFRTPGK